MNLDLVPDSITPVEGWKTFDAENGTLKSPNFCTFWSKQQALQAHCGVHLVKYRWVVASGNPPESVVQEHVGTLTFGGGIVTTVAFSPDDMPAKPRTLLPPGKHWALEQEVITHSAPAQGCSCGIYLAKSPDEAVGYGEILAKVKGWGTVVEHEDGWRVENAYPSHLYAATMDEALKLAEYGIPVTLIEDIEDEGVKLAALAARPSVMVPPKVLQRVVRFAPLLLLGILLMQWGFFVHNPNAFTGTAFILASFAAAVLFTVIKPWKPWP